MFIALFYSYLFITQQKFSLVPKNLLEESLNFYTPVDSCSFLDRKKTYTEPVSEVLKLKNVAKTNMRLFRYCAYHVFTSSYGKSYWAAEVSAYVKGSTITYKLFYLQDT